MRCPYCGHDEAQVKDSRPSEDGAAIRRRRMCPACEGRFTTFERVQLRERTLLKRSGRRTPFDRDKRTRSVAIAIRKRPLEPDRVERMVSEIIRQLESTGETKRPSSTIGELMMKPLKQRRLRPLRLGLSGLPGDAGLRAVPGGRGAERGDGGGAVGGGDVRSLVLIRRGRSKRPLDGRQWCPCVAGRVQHRSTWA